MTFERNSRDAKIHGLSIQVGELFAEIYRFGDNASQEEALNALEAYKYLRRLLPSVWAPHIGENRHIGYNAAHKATQGMS